MFPELGNEQKLLNIFFSQNLSKSRMKILETNIQRISLLLFRFLFISFQNNHSGTRWWNKFFNFLFFSLQKKFLEYRSKWRLSNEYFKICHFLSKYLEWKLYNHIFTYLAILNYLTLDFYGKKFLMVSSCISMFLSFNVPISLGRSICFMFLYKLN